jgi:hypothetical protein
LEPQKKEEGLNISCSGMSRVSQFTLRQIDSVPIASASMVDVLEKCAEVLDSVMVHKPVEAYRACAPTFGVVLLMLAKPFVWNVYDTVIEQAEQILSHADKLKFDIEQETETYNKFKETISPQCSSSAIDDLWLKNICSSLHEQDKPGCCWFVEFFQPVNERQEFRARHDAIKYLLATFQFLSPQLHVDTPFYEIQNLLFRQEHKEFAMNEACNQTPKRQKAEEELKSTRKSCDDLIRIDYFEESATKQDCIVLSLNLSSSFAASTEHFPQPGTGHPLEYIRDQQRYRKLQSVPKWRERLARRKFLLSCCECGGVFADWEATEYVTAREIQTKQRLGTFAKQNRHRRENEDFESTYTEVLTPMEELTKTNCSFDNRKLTDPVLKVATAFRVAKSLEAYIHTSRAQGRGYLEMLLATNDAQLLYVNPASPSHCLPANDLMKLRLEAQLQAQQHQPQDVFSLHAPSPHFPDASCKFACCHPTLKTEFPQNLNPEASDAQNVNENTLKKRRLD